MNQRYSSTSPPRRRGIGGRGVARGIMAAVTLASLLGLGPRSSLAAPGDNLASFDASVTAGIPACAVGTGLAYDGTNLILSCWGSNVLERVHATTHLNSGAVTILGLPAGNDLQALAWDATRSRLWACNGHSTVVLINLTLGVVDLSITPFSVPACTDGLAYDGTDDTLWLGPDVASTIYHYTTSGTLIASHPLGGLIGGCGKSGIAVGGPDLFIANNGCSEIYRVPKTFASSTLFASFPARLEDLECDGKTFAPNGAIWSQDAYDRILNAWEIEPGLCAFGGLGECGDGNLDAGEQCDDNNLVNGDGCDANCQLETPQTTTTSVQTTSTSTTTVPADHFKCYKTRTQPFAQRQVSLVDQFVSSTATVLRPNRLCNPADKNGEGINDPTAHLMCYQIREGSFASRTALVRNQFGDQTVTVVKPESLCNPADKDGIPRQTNGNHFKCYRVRAPGFTTLTANVTDQFETQATTLAKLRLLCNPVDKNGEGIVDPQGHLACYTIKGGGPSFTPRDVTVMDQFAQQDLSALQGECRRRSLLCVPSEKNPSSPSGAFLEQPTGALL